MSQSITFAHGVTCLLSSYVFFLVLFSSATTFQSGTFVHGVTLLALFLHLFPRPYSSIFAPRIVRTLFPFHERFIKRKRKQFSQRIYSDFFSVGKENFEIFPAEFLHKLSTHSAGRTKPRVFFLSAAPDYRNRNELPFPLAERFDKSRSFRTGSGRKRRSLYIAARVYFAVPTQERGADKKV